VRAGAGSVASERDDAADVTERQAKAPRLSDERQDAESVSRIDAVPGGGTTWGRENPALLVEPQRPATHAALLGQFSNQETMASHAPRIEPDLCVKVERPHEGSSPNSAPDPDAAWIP
jgi:hypothetical protein